jgi:HSP20 family protein
MAKTEVTKPTEPSVTRPRDIFSAMRDEMDQMFGRFERDWPRWPGLFRRWDGGQLMVPDLDVHESDKLITIEADLPGVEEKDVSVKLANGILTIKGEKRQAREEKEENYYLAERSFGSFERSLRLPETIDDSKIDARFEKGVLRITAPKRPEAQKAERKIAISKA